LRVGLSKDEQFEDNYVNVQFTNQTVELQMTPKINAPVSALIRIRDSVFFAGIDDTTVWLGTTMYTTGQSGIAVFNNLTLN